MEGVQQQAPPIPPGMHVKFDAEKFQLLTLNEKLNSLAPELIDGMQLQVPSQKVSSHVCALIKQPPNRNTGWMCDKIKGANRCLSGLTGFYQSNGIPEYRCAACNFDMCEKCMRADLFIEMHSRN